MTFNEKNIFLLDGIGATLSAVVAGLLLPRFHDWIGLKPWMLQILGVIAAAYAAYSLVCYFIVPRTKPFLLATIITANLFYCILTASILITYLELTALGQTYFVFEILLILFVIYLEAMVYWRAFGKRPPGVR